jgi:low molecular weight protein-tyrosine phosphatase
LVYERFGSRKGLLLFLYHWLFAQVGVYSRFARVRPERNQRLVFVCSGNICRSPLAEAYARSLGKDSASCGLHCGDGFPADHRARAFASQHGFSLEDHKTVNVRDFEFQNTDLIVVMEPAHITSFQDKVGKKYQLALAGSYCDRPYPYIHDPFNTSDEFFTHCEQRVMEAVRGLCA